VKSWLFDGIVWVAVGVTLLAQAVFVVSIGWWPAEDGAPTSVPPTVAGAIVAGGFVVAGVVALTVGVRRLRRARGR
jgi:hypothetical protein